VALSLPDDSRHAVSESLRDTGDVEPALDFKSARDLDANLTSQSELIQQEKIPKMK
jgi:hypothetical protein